MCETCDRFIQSIAAAQLQRDEQAERVFRALLNSHIQACPDYRLVRQLWPGQDVRVVEGALPGGGCD